MTTLAITNAHIVPVEGEPFDGTLIAQDGRITAMGAAVEVPESAQVVDAHGRWLLPGFIDAHTHLGVCEEGEGWAGDDTNEMSSPNTAGVRALDAIDPADTAFQDALTGGVTCVNITPGSANVLGGEMVAVRTHGTVVDNMVLKSPTGLKAALGENPKRVYGKDAKLPSTRLGIAYVLRQAWCDALEYRAQRAKDPEHKRDLALENLVRVLDGELPFRQHCHRADDIATAIRVAEEFGYRLVVEHGTDGATIASHIAAHQVPVLMGPMLTNRAKVELRHRGLENPGRLEAAGVELCLITDHPVVPIEHLVLSAILCVKHGLSRDGALRAITLNPARVLGLEDRIGSLSVGKDADLVLWSGDPLDAMSFADQVWLRGQVVYSREL